MPSTVVVDLGCQDYHGPDISRPRLLDQFKPAMFFGWDPQVEVAHYTLGDTMVVLLPWAAWTRDGSILLSDSPSGLDATVVETSERWRDGGPRVTCRDFSAWLAANFSHGGVTVKMDIEGAEFAVLQKMRRDGTDRLVDRLLMAWHDHFLADEYGRLRGELEGGLACPVEEWS